MDREDEADVVVIGSGAGGAPVAARLAEAGAKVVMVEEGPELDRDSFNGDVQACVATAYRNGGALAALGLPPVAMQVGSCVGGSTVINGGTCFRTPPDVLAAWSALCRGAFKPSEIEPYFGIVERDLHVKEVDAKLAFLGERMLLEAALANGDKGGFVKRNAHLCQGAGLCPFVCPTGAKQSMERTYVPRFVHAGGILQSRTRAQRIVVRGGLVLGVRVHNAAGEEQMIRCRQVALCAGALHSPVLLRHSLSARTPRAAGRNLRVHPGVHVIGVFDAAIVPRSGPIQSIYIEGRDAPYVIFGMGYPPEVLAPLLIGGSAELGKLASYTHTITVAVMASDHDGRGRVIGWPNGGISPVYQLGEQTASCLRRGTAHAARLLLAIGAQEVYHHVRGFAPFASPADVDRFEEAHVPRRALMPGSVHPMGTCRMGADPADSVVDPFNRVHGVRGLYVPDASFFPSHLGVNPQITINAFALRTADTMAKDAGAAVSPLRASGT